MSASITEWTDYQDLRRVHGFTYGEVAHLLDAAAAHLEAYGWCRALLYDGLACCVRGAIMLAAGYTNPADPVPPSMAQFRRRYLAKITEDAVGYWLADTTGRPAPMHVPSWNDGQCSSAEEAVAVLREVAAFVREGDE